MRGAGRNRRSPMACRATAGSAPGCRSKSRSARRTGPPPSSRSATAIPSPAPTRRPRTNGTASPTRWRCHATGPERDSACGPDQPREPDCAACRQRTVRRCQPRTAMPRRSARIVRGGGCAASPHLCDGVLLGPCSHCGRHCHGFKQLPGFQLVNRVADAVVLANPLPECARGRAHGRRARLLDGCGQGFWLQPGTRQRWRRNPALGQAVRPERLVVAKRQHHRGDARRQRGTAGAGTTVMYGHRHAQEQPIVRCLFQMEEALGVIGGSGIPGPPGRPSRWPATRAARSVAPLPSPWQ